MNTLDNALDTLPPGTTVLSLDFETFSEVNLKVHGLDRYTAHPSFEAMMCAWRVNDEPVQMWVRCQHGRQLPRRLVELLRDPKVVKKAWNAQFERVVLGRHFGIAVPPSEWRCSMVRSMMLSLPGSLDEAGTVIGLGEKFSKSKEGKALIQLFCVPKKPTAKHPYTRYTAETHPEQWARFVEYCRQDVVAECKIDRILAKYEIPARMWKVYALDQKINDRGVPIDMQLVNNAIGMVQRRQNEIKAELRRLTALPNANSVQQMLPWARERGYPFDSLGKERIDRAFEDFGDSMSDDCKAALRLRRSGAKGSVKKYAAFLKFVGEDGRLRYQFQFAGAGRTMRFAGRGVQLQNLKRPRKDHEPFLAEIREMIRQNDYEGLEIIFGDVMEVLSSSIRSAIAPVEGRAFTVADLNAIETRLCGWVSGSEELARIFKRKECPYKHFAALLFGVPYAEVTKAMRGTAKAAVLGCFFQLGGGGEVGKYPDVIKTGLWAYAESMGIKLTKAEAHAQVALFRSAFPEAGVMWAELSEAAIQTIQTGESHKAGALSFDAKGPFMRMLLPSGRRIYYLRPKAEMQTIKHANGTFEKLGVSYEGKDKVGHWGRVKTHGGKFVENCFAADTIVLTLCGPKRIVDVGIDDAVFDGHAWVSHTGLLERGVAETIHIGGGVRVTPDHLIDVNREWQRADCTTYEEAASSFSRHYRLPEFLAGGALVSWLGRPQIVVESALRLRQSDCAGRVGAEEDAAKVVRLSPLRDDSESQPNTRDVAAPGLLGVAVDVSEMQQPESRGLQKLRRPGDQSLQAVGSVVSEFLGRCAEQIPTRFDDGPNEQRSGLLAEQCSVGEHEGADAKQARQCADRHAEGSHDDLGSGGSFGDLRRHDRLPSRGRSSGCEDVRRTGFREEVYDLTNCGPNNRFCVVGDDGRLILVHNCAQATAFDILSEGMLAADARGFEIIFTVHDEIVAETDLDDPDLTVQALCSDMTVQAPWRRDLLLEAAGYADVFYRKD